MPRPSHPSRPSLRVAARALTAAGAALATVVATTESPPTAPVPASTPAPVPAPAPAAALARTGTDPAPLVSLAAGLVVGGAVLLLAGRRRARAA